MRVTGMPWLLMAVALGLLGGAAPALAMTQQASPTARGSDTAQCQPGAENTAEATSDQTDAAPAELQIDQPFGHAWLGSADADVTLVVFADYACPACRDAQPVIDQLLAQDRKLKVVYRLVDNDQGGRTAALTSLAVAASKSADWGKFHLALDASGDLSSKAIADAVAASGVEPAKLPHVENADDPQTLSLAQELSHNDLLINQRHGTVLPAWLIGDGPAQKGFDLPRLQAAIAKARAGPKR
jgi:protein-disulfide isomerase